MTDNLPNPLVGAWVSEPSERTVGKRLGRIIYDFFPEGIMRQKYVNNHGAYETKCKYKIEKNVIVFNSPPLHDARSKFKLTDDGKLILYENGKQYPFVRKT